MKNKDFLVEQILSVEDFENVDAELMQKISSNDEYRRIFEECKELSNALSECVPSPEKNGVSLHDAVMNRVKAGDTAPRYTGASSGKFRFPIATVASLAIIAVVAITLGINTRMQKNGKDASEYEVYDEESGNINAEFNVLTDRKNAEVFASPKMASEYSDEEVAENAIVTEAEAPEGVMLKGDDGVQAVAEEAETEVAETGVAETEAEKTEAVSEDRVMMKASGAGSANGQMKKAPQEETALESESFEYYITKDGADFARDKAETYGYTVTVDGAELVIYDIDKDISEKLELVKEYDIPKDRQITTEDIEKYGKESFVEWFSEIYGRDDFASLYDIREYIKYCEEH